MADVIGRLANESPNRPSGDNPQLRPSLYRGLVIDVIHDVSILDEKQMLDLSRNVKNKLHLFNAPRNSCIIKIISGNLAKTDEKDYLVCFPFFPPYLAMPIKPGEHVWVFIEDPNDGDGTDLGYWLCRISEFLHVDDINFTHSDRTYTSLTNSPNDKIDKNSKSGDEIHRGLGFPNGVGTPDGYRLSDELGYEKIYSGSLGMQSVTLEPVPRFTKRPGDLVLQGSNNACIVLGEDRGWTKRTVNEATTAEWSNATSTGPTSSHLKYPDGLAPFKGQPPPQGVADRNERTFSGTIDIVVGRARIMPSPESAAELTACRVIENSRKYYEVDKNPLGAMTSRKSDNRFESPAEGDPDFFNDASRIYVSMNTLSDFNFDITYPQVPIAGSSNNGVDIEILEEKVDGLGHAAVVIKSDEVRIVARQDMNIDPPIQGSITLIKEGDSDNEAGTGRGIITIRPDGVIMIDGPKIVLGSGIKKANGEGAQVAVGLGATEPMVLGDALIGLLYDFANQLLTSMTTSVGNLGAPVLFPGYDKLFIDNWRRRLEAEARSRVAKLL